MRAAKLYLALATFLPACGRTANGGALTDTGGAGRDVSGGSGSVGGTGGASGAPTECDRPSPGSSPITHLRSREYMNTLRALFPDYVVSLDPPFELAPTDDFTVQGVADLHRIAHQAARDVSSDPQLLRAVTDCEPAGDADGCRAHFIEHFTPRAFRRPTTADERAELTAVFDTGRRLGHDFASGVRAVLEVALQSPELVYLPELGDGNESDGSVTLTPYETATRLAYFVTSAPPDDELSSVAAHAELGPDGIEQQARRLLGSPASRAQVQAFYRERYYLGWRFGSAVDEPAPAFTTLALEEADRFIADVTFDGAGTFRALLTEPTTWVNETLARHYGYTGVSGEEFRKLQLDPSQRGGLFTQASFLAAGSSGVFRPIQRSMTVLSRLLCQPIEPPPPNIEFPPPDASTLPTTREQLARFTAGPSCQKCHELLNPVGFAFEHFDGFGKFRNMEGERPIDSSGELIASDARGRFQDAGELLARIAESKDAKACFVQQWLELAYRRAMEPADACTGASLREGFDRADGNVVELIVALAQSDNFRFRQKSELPSQD